MPCYAALRSKQKGSGVLDEAKGAKPSAEDRLGTGPDPYAVTSGAFAH